MGNRARNALDIRGEGRIVLQVIGGVVAHHIDHGHMPFLRIVDIGEAVAEAGAKVQERGGGALGDARKAIRGSGNHPLEQAQHAAHALDLIQRGDKMHLRRSGVGKTHRDTVVHQRCNQAFCTVHDCFPYASIGISLRRGHSILATV